MGARLNLRVSPLRPAAFITAAPQTNTADANRRRIGVLELATGGRWLRAVPHERGTALRYSLCEELEDGGDIAGHRVMGWEAAAELEAGDVASNQVRTGQPLPGNGCDA